MSKKVALIYGEEYLKYNFSPSHPLQSIRLKMTVELMRAYGILDQPGVEIVSPRLATDEELKLIHTPDYIQKVKEASKNPAVHFFEYGLGEGDNPVFSGMHEAASYAVGGSLRAAELVMQGEAEHCFNIGGGLHHALKDQASGFCIYNDPAIVIADILQKHNWRVAYIDIDAHHGDGVERAFYNSPQVLTISLHESGRYLFPGSGFIEEIGQGEGEGFSVNVPLEPLTFDEAYLFAFQEIVPPLVRAFKPDFIISQNGCDAHILDPLTHLAVSLKLYRKLTGLIHQLAHNVADGRWVALGGGGYELFRVVPRAWTVTFAEMSGINLAEEIPAAWSNLYRKQVKELAPSALFEDPEINLSQGQKEEIMRMTEQTVQELKQKIFPVHGLATL